MSRYYVRCSKCGEVTARGPESCPSCGESLTDAAAAAVPEHLRDPSGIPVFAGLLVIVSLVTFLSGFAMLTEAALGVGILTMTCVLTIWARIAQASANHEALIRELRRHRS